MRILLPAHNNWPLVGSLSRGGYRTLLSEGVRLFEWQGPMIHAKTMVVDGVFSTVGTSNVDYRSFSINFEINALIYDKKIAAKLENSFFNDLQESRRLDPEEWYARPLKQKIKESYCRLWAPIL